MDNTQSLMELGKIPPQAVDIEAVVLGGIMLDKEALEGVVQILDANNFYSQKHEFIFQSIKALYARSEPVDILTVTQELRALGTLNDAGGALYVTQLTNRVAGGANSEFHARIIKQKFIQRELIRAATATLQSAYEDTIDVLDMVSEHQARIDKIDENLREGKSLKSMKQLSDQTAIDYINREKARVNGDVTGVPTGLRKLNEATGGWQKSDLIILASRPGVGKSALACMFAITAAKAGFDVLFDSVEMKAIQLYGRMLMMESKLHSSSFKYANYSTYDKEVMMDFNRELAKLKIHIDDEASTDVAHTTHRARKIKKKGNLGLIICDYLQLKEPPSGKKYNNREQEISFISRSLKGLAKEMDCPVIALSSLSRDVEKRGGEKRPMLSDLRESGAIEHDADMVIFPYRPGYYNKNDDNLKGIGELIIAKHRNGSVEDVLFRHNESLTSFWDVDSNNTMPL